MNFLYKKGAYENQVFIRPFLGGENERHTWCLFDFVQGIGYRFGFTGFFYPYIADHEGS